LPSASTRAPELLLGRGQERVPDHPGIDGAALEGGASPRPAAGTRLDVGIGDAGLFQRLDQQEVHVRALVQRDLPALQVGQAAQAGPFGTTIASDAGDGGSLPT
jgi:hypothetical protein